MATAAYGIFDLATSKLVLASAGHLPPLLITRDGAAPVELVPAAPLGVLAYGTCSEYEVTLGEGDLVVLYTDGLIERRGESIDDGIATLAETVRDASSAEQACDRAVAALVPADGLGDDAAILVLRNEPVPFELHVPLYAYSDVLHEVRLMLRRWLRERGAAPDEIEDLTLAVGEACAGVVQHADAFHPARFTLDAYVRDGEATFVIRDGGLWDDGDDRRRALAIMEGAMDSVAIEDSETITTVTMRRRLGRG